MPPTLDSSEIGIAFRGASSVEHKRFTQHNFRTFKSKNVKSVIFGPPSSLHLMIIDFFNFRLLILPNETKNFLFTSSLKPLGVSSTLQTNVSFDSASVLTILILP